MDTQRKITFSAKTIGYALVISVALCLGLPCISVVAYPLLMLLSLVVNYICVIFYNNVYELFIAISKPVCISGENCDYQLGCGSEIIGSLILIFFARIIFELLPIIFQALITALAYIFRGLITLLSFIITSGVILVYRFFTFIFTGIYKIIRAIIFGLTVFFKFLFSTSYLVLRALLVGGKALFKLIGAGAYISFKFICASSYIILRAILYGMIVFFKYLYICFYTVLRSVLLGLTIIADWLFSKRRIRHICPNEDCGYIGASPVYRCPHCGEFLINLKPSYDGIFYRKCPNCNKDVSISCLTGRDKYAIACPKCNNTWDYFNVGNAPSSVFIVEGAPQSGKTSFLVQMLIQWRSHFSKHVHFLIDNQKNTVNQLGSRIHEQKFCPSTTRLLHPEAYVMHSKKLFHSFLAYFYDTGGDNTSYSLQAGVAEPYFNLANGIFLVIDPWAERCVIDAFGGNNFTPPQTYIYAKQDANEVIGKLCSKLDHIYTRSFNSGFNIPICIVVTKCDINKLDKSIGIPASYSQTSNEWKEQSKLVEDFLVIIGMFNFVSVIKTRFKKYAFFAVSVLDDSTHNPETVLNPLLWMMYQVNNFK